MKQNHSQQPMDVIIVGGGIAGLLAATHLQAAGRRVLVLDEEPVPGGRMASRQTTAGLADDGAQFFTVRQERFGRFVAQWLADGRLFQWSQGWGEDDGHPRYAVQGGMNQLPAFLAESVPVKCDVTVTAVAPTNKGWQVVADAGAVWHGRALLLTPPAPQSLALLANGRVSLHDDDAAALRRIHLAPSITGLFRVHGQVRLPHPGAVQAMDQPIVWIADNRRKGLTGQPLLTVHAGPDYSQTYFEADDEKALAGHMDAVRPYLTPQSTLEPLACKRWRYALPLALHPGRTLLARDLPPLAFSGDA
ncbi:MAG: NAD(P)/FAD-dependent oxidoreductase, partial [Anaerolineae bacterium]